MATPRSEKTKDTRKRLESCWNMDLSWDLYPQVLKEVSTILHAVLEELTFTIEKQGWWMKHVNVHVPWL